MKTQLHILISKDGGRPVWFSYRDVKWLLSAMQRRYVPQVRPAQGSNGCCPILFK